MVSRIRTGAAAVCVGLAFLVPAATRGQVAPARADSVHLRFAWPAGTSARVETTRFQERIAVSADTTSGGAQYRMNVRAHDDGLLISYDDFVFRAPTDTSDAATLNSFAEQASAIVPRFIVDSAGAFVRIEDIETVKAQFDSLMTRMLPPDEAAAARETLATLLTEDALAGVAAQEWNTLVGMWAGADFAIGEVYEFEEQASLPMIAGATVAMASEFSVAGRTSCMEGGARADCVEIHLVSHPDPDAMREVLAQFMQQLLATPGLGGLAFESLEMENEMVLVTEPSTLRPHRVRLSRSVTGVVTAEGERSEVTQRDVRTYQYTYAY